MWSVRGGEIRPPPTDRNFLQECVRDVVSPRKPCYLYLVEPEKKTFNRKFRTQQNHDGTKVALFLISPYLAPKFY
jgi:hypothetical protein